MSRRCTYTASFSVGGDIPTWEGEVEFSYLVSWGAPEQGPTYASGGQPADPDEIDDLRVEAIDGRKSGWSEYQSDAEVAQDMAERLTDDDYAAMLTEAQEQAVADHDAAMEARWEDRREAQAHA